MSDEARTNEVDGEAVLKRRAARLARRVTDVGVLSASEYAVFTLAREQYAIETRYLSEVVPLRDLALLPGADAPLLGLTAWRGSLLRIIDLGAALGRPQGGPTDRNRALVLADEQAAFGVLIDVVDDMIELPNDAVLELPGNQDREDEPFLRGVTADAILVLDGAALLRTFA